MPSGKRQKMKKVLRKKSIAGFALIEIFLSILIVVVIAGLTVIYFTKMNESTLLVKKSDSNSNNGVSESSSQPLTQITAPSGTTDNINQLLQQALEAEKNIDSSIDASILDNATSPDSAITNIGGAYDASNL